MFLDELFEFLDIHDLVEDPDFWLTFHDDNPESGPMIDIGKAVKILDG